MSSDNARDPAAGERWQQVAVELVRGELSSPPGLGPRIAINGQGRLYIAASAISRVLLGGPATVPAPRVTARRALPLSSNHTCTSRHAFPIRVRQFPGVTHSSAIVAVNGRHAPVYVCLHDAPDPGDEARPVALNRKRFRAFVDLRGLVRRRYAVRVTAATTDGRVLGATAATRPAAAGPPGRSRASEHGACASASGAPVSPRTLPPQRGNWAVSLVWVAWLLARAAHAGERNRALNAGSQAALAHHRRRGAVHLPNRRGKHGICDCCALSGALFYPACMQEFSSDSRD
jgi:hypothetical protein